MFERTHINETVTVTNLRRLVVLRNIVLMAQGLVIILAIEILKMDLPVAKLLLVLSCYALANGYTYWDLGRRRDIAAPVFFLHVVLDVAALSAFLYLTGGATNPFVSLLLLPLVIIATTMTRRFTWGMAVLTMVAYSTLMFFHTPLQHAHHGQGTDFDLHVLGMWVSFLVGAGLIVAFVVRMAENLRQRDRKLAEARERLLQDEHLVALGTLAAGAAHEMGTPLATMAVVTRELEHSAEQMPEIAAQARILRQQVDRCKVTLSRMTAQAGQHRAEGGSGQALDDFLAQTVMQWQNMRPKVQVRQHFSGSHPAPVIVADTTFMQAIINLLNNAADAADDREVEIAGSWDARHLTLEVCDQGPGLPQPNTGFGQAFFTTKEEGRGLGLFLARAVMDRIGGKLTLQNRTSGGACARIELPLGLILTHGGNPS